MAARRSSRASVAVGAWFGARRGRAGERRGAPARCRNAQRTAAARGRARARRRRDAAGRARGRRRRRCRARGAALVQELAYGTLRHWGTLDALATGARDQAASRRALAALVAVALYQLDHTRRRRSPSSTSAVDAAAADRAPGAPRRSSTRCCAATCASARRCNARGARAIPVARWSHPRWWIDRRARRLARRTGRRSSRPATSARR